MPLVRFLFAALLAVSLQCAAAPFAIRLGDTRVVLDAPPGFADTTFTGSPRLQDAAESLTSPSNRVLLFALTDGDLRRFTQGDVPDLKRLMIVSTPREFERDGVTAGAFGRLSAELLGPEYSMRWNSLDSGLQLFFSREVRGRAGEDLVEKQNAEMGVMPVVPEEYVAYGYTNEDRHFVRVFLGKEAPRLTFADGVEVVKLLMTAYQSAEQGKTLAFPPRGLTRFVPAVAKGTWKPEG